MVSQVPKKQCPISLELETDVDTEITHMITEGIFELYDDPKRFDIQSLFYVRKAARSK